MASLRSVTRNAASSLPSGIRAQAVAMASSLPQVPLPDLANPQRLLKNFVQRVEGVLPAGFPRFGSGMPLDPGFSDGLKTAEYRSISTSDPQVRAQEQSIGSGGYRSI